MGKVLYSATMSLDGFIAGPNQSVDNPLGVGGKALHSWFYPTRTFQKMFGKDEGTTGTDDDFAARGSVRFADGFSFLLGDKFLLQQFLKL